MPLLLVSLLQREGGHAPLSSRSLPGQDEPRHARTVELLEVGREILATATLWISRMPDVLVQIAHSDRLIAMALPPDGKQSRERLPTAVALLGLADALDRILAAERQEGVAHPPTPLLEAA